MISKLKEIKVKEQSQDFVDMEAIVAESNQLLLEAHDKDKKVLDSLNISTELKHERKLNADIKRTVQAEKIYEKEVFTGSQIKELCQMYDLKMLSTRRFKGRVPSHLARVVAEFAEKHEIDLERRHDDSFFILAPVEMFNTDKVKRVAPQKDPILFYRQPNNGTTSHNREYAQLDDAFVQIMNWGHDFQTSRKNRVHWNDYDGTSGMPNFLRTLLAITVIVVSIIVGFFFMTVIPTIAGIIFAGFMLAHNLNSKSFKAYKKLWNNSEV